MSGEPHPVERQFSSEDDDFHFDELGDGWWATETAWFSFHHPERRLGGWLYTMVRPNIGTVAGGIWIWDETATLPWEVPYYTNYSALEFPRDSSLRDIALPTGVRLRTIKPATTYALSAQDGERLSLDLTFDAVMAPQPLGTGTTFGTAQHYDQFGRVTGELVLHGERIEIDCIAMRDRTWSSRRPEDRPRKAAYVTGAVRGGDAFLAVTAGKSDEDPVVHGFLTRDGHTSRLVSGLRTVERDQQSGAIVSIAMEGVDSDGREFRADGTPRSQIVVNRHTFIDVNSLVEWTIDGQTGWGEDQDMWPVHTWSAARRAARTSPDGA
jgi:hypothetical protein